VDRVRVCLSSSVPPPDFASAWCFDKEYIVSSSSSSSSSIYFWYDVGQISRALAPYVAQLVGVDISPRMVEVYNTRASMQGLEPHEMRAVSSLTELQQQRFDLAVVSHR
jgi:Methyltransferase domain